jgi:hypothetical protein
MEPSPREHDVTIQLTTLLEQEEVMWRQRSRVQWLADGDKNTRFFHLRASQRRRKNKVTEMVKEDGSIESREPELGNMATQFYKNLYTSEGVQDMDEVLRIVPSKVTLEMNIMLDAPFQAEEVKAALYEMYPTKSLRSDGFPAFFF